MDMNKENQLSFWSGLLYALLGATTAAVTYIPMANFFASVVGYMYYNNFEPSEIIHDFEGFGYMSLFFGVIAIGLAFIGGILGAAIVVNHARIQTFWGALAGGLVPAFILSFAVNNFMFSNQKQAEKADKEFHQALEIQEAALQSVHSLPFRFQELLNVNDFVYDFAISPDQQIMAYSFEKQIILWDLAQNVQIGSTFNLSLGSFAFDQPEFSPDGRWLASVDNDKVIVWSIPTAQQTYTLRGRKMAISPDSTMLAAIEDGNIIILYELSTGQEITRLKNDIPVGLSSLEFSPDGRLLATGGNYAVFLWNLEKRELIGRSYLPDRPDELEVEDIAFSPDSKKLAASTRWDLAVWDTEVMQSLGGVPNTFSGGNIQFSPDGHWLMSSNYSNEIHLWNTDTQAPAGKITNPALQGTLDARFLPDGHLLALFRTHEESWESKIGILEFDTP
jgi:hypothetical protein